MTDAPAPTADVPPGRLKEIVAWAMYDWANSAYSTLLITVILHYLQEVVLPGRAGVAAYAGGIGAAMLLVALASPVLGAVADANRSKRRCLAVTALGGAAAAVAMGLLPPQWPAAVVAAFVLMSVMFDLALVPYNGFLPEITTPQTINRVSAFGFSMGYLGGSIPLAATLGLVKFGPQFGLDAELQHRAALLLLGAWWGGFTLPALLVLRDRGPRRRQSLPAAAREALTEVGRTLASVRRFPALAWFLLAFLFYNDGMQTVITQANTLASKDFQFTLEELCVFVLVIQLVALPSSLAVGWLADRVGVKPTLLGCLTVWLGLLLGVAVVSSAIQFWVLGIVLATVLGGTQAVSRAAVGLMTPARRAAEFFGFFNVSGKAAAFLGPVLFASVYGWTQSTRAAAASIIPFFLVGGAIVAAINFAAGRRQALEPNPETDSS